MLISMLILFNAAVLFAIVPFNSEFDVYTHVLSMLQYVHNKAIEIRLY